MMQLPRTDRSELSQWWWTVDHWSLAALVVLMAMGAVLILAASPAAGGRIDLPSFHLASRQLLLLGPALLMMIAISLLSPRWARRTGVLGLPAALLLCLATLIVGTELNGAARWVQIAGLSVQPSELLKPCFAVVTAWLLTVGHDEGRPGMGMIATLVLWALVSLLLLLQPDFGQFALVTAIAGVQLFLAGLPLAWVGAMAALGGAAMLGGYLLLPHVASRVDRFLDRAAGDHYQIERSLDAFGSGGLFGRGPGEGTVKAQLPDSHSDFIFAVAGEELGLIACLIIVALFAFVVLRGLVRASGQRSPFAMIAAAGLLTQFGLQAIINMSSTLHLIPTKGMTLPFISYGGSSLVGMALTMGLALALTRRRSDGGEAE